MKVNVEKIKNDIAEMENTPLDLTSPGLTIWESTSPRLLYTLHCSSTFIGSI